MGNTPLFPFFSFLPCFLFIHYYSYRNYENMIHGSYLVNLAEVLTIPQDLSTATFLIIYARLQPHVYYCVLSRVYYIY